MAFPFEETPIYKLALHWANDIEDVCQLLKAHAASGLGDQLRRAALSIPLNFAEGYGRWHKGDKQQFYRIALGSVFECVPILQILKLRRVLSPEEYQGHYGKLQEIAKMLTGLIKSLDGAKTGV